MIGFSAFHEFTPFAKESFLSFGTLLKNKPLYGLFPETALAILDGSNSLVVPFLPLIGKSLNSDLLYCTRSKTHLKVFNQFTI